MNSCVPDVKIMMENKRIFPSKDNFESFLFHNELAMEPPELDDTINTDISFLNLFTTLISQKAKKLFPKPLFSTISLVDEISNLISHSKKEES